MSYTVNPCLSRGFSAWPTGYVEQFDTLLPELTVREMLLYTAELKCARSEPLAKKSARVEQLLEVLALQNCAGTLIGDSLARGISGGQVRHRCLQPRYGFSRLRRCGSLRWHRKVVRHLSRRSFPMQAAVCAL